MMKQYNRVLRGSLVLWIYVHIDREVKKGSDLVGKIVLFTVKDAGRKSLEARNVVLADESVPLSVVGGRIVAWDG